MRDLASTFCRRSPCLPRAAPSLMIPTDYGANIESWEGQHRHKETQGRPTWTHRWPTQTQAYNRNTGKEIQAKGCRCKCCICYLNFLLNAHHFGQDNCFCLLQKLLWGKCYALFKSKCSSTSVEMSNCQLFRPDLIFRLPSQPCASVNTTKCHRSSPLSSFNRSSPLSVVKFLYFCQF